MGLSTSSTSTITTVAGDFVAAENISDYEYDEDAFDAGSCNLDKASGAIHPTTGEYSYFLTEDYPWTPIYYFGNSGPSSLCSLPRIDVSKFYAHAHENKL